MNRINLTNNKGYKWFVKKLNNREVYAKGFLIDADKIYCESNMVEYISNFDIEELPEKLKRIDGQFAIVIRELETIFAAVDHMRSFPLFYKKTDESYCLFDAVQKEDWANNSVDSQQERIFLNTTYTLETNTFFKDYFQVASGRYALINSQGAEIKKYWDFSYAKDQITDMKSAVELIRNGYEHAFKLCKELVGNKKIVIPLSGGYDSRLVLNGLLKAGVSRDKIITFTCGIEEYEDSNISKIVADAIGVKNYYINYNTPQARKYFKKDFKKYALHSSVLSSTPHLQEWYAISELVRKNLIDEECVFMPGYGGVLPGHYIKQEFFTDDKDNIENIIRKALRPFGSCKARPTEKDIKDTVDEILNTSYFASLNAESSSKDYVECYERFIYMEEQSKYIQNSTRNYDYVGCQCITVFFLKEQFDLWSKIDNSLRLNNSAFMECMDEYLLPELKSIPFTGSKVAKKMSQKQNRVQKLMDFMFNRTKMHYMFGMFPLTTYYRCFFQQFYIKLDYLSGWEMLRVLKNKR